MVQEFFGVLERESGERGYMVYSEISRARAAITKAFMAVLDAVRGA